MKIKAGTSKMIWKRGVGGVGWHMFGQDCKAEFKVDKQTYSELLVVKSGPDAGTYLFAI